MVIDDSDDRGVRRPHRGAPWTVAALVGILAAAIVSSGVPPAPTPASATATAAGVTATAAGVTATTAGVTATTSGTAVPVVVPALTVAERAAAATPRVTSAAPLAARSGNGSRPVPGPTSEAPGRPSTAPATASGARTDTQTVVLAGGCFWGVQGVYQHVRGVTIAESGYTGGTRDTANYEAVSTGTTGHAESVRITFDPAQVTYEQILQIFFSVAHDPTELDRQGPDTGPQYRSEVFAQNQVQQWVATAYLAQLTGNAVFAEPIVTEVEIDTDFFPAEVYHQDFLAAHPSYPYIEVNDMPKLRELQRRFPQLYRSTPVLYLATGH